MSRLLNWFAVVVLIVFVVQLCNRPPKYYGTYVIYNGTEYATVVKTTPADSLTNAAALSRLNYVLDNAGVKYSLILCTTR